MTYSDKLTDVRWQKKRLEIMKRDKFSCRSCYAHEGTMHVHHLRYLKRFDPWQYEDDDMITLCSECHAEWHRLFDNNIQPGKTFLVAKLHFDLDVEAMQGNKKIEPSTYSDILLTIHNIIQSGVSSKEIITMLKEWFKKL